MTKALAVVSGGLDSVTMLHQLVHDGYECDVVSFDYGQRHKKELQFAKAHAQMLNLQHDIVDLRSLTEFLSNSALTSFMTFDGPDADARREVEVPEGHYAEENMRATVVPNRNMIMLSIACGVAVNRGLNTIAAAMHAGDHYIYPDCRPPFIFSLGMAMLQGNEGFHKFSTGSVWDGVDMDDEEQVAKAQKIVEMGFSNTAMPITTPFLNSTKTDIAKRAFELNVPIHMTWSCYKGGENHCGRCGTCVERLEAIDGALLELNAQDGGMGWAKTRVDLTVYDDTEFWKTTQPKKVEEVAHADDYEPHYSDDIPGETSELY